MKINKKYKYQQPNIILSFFISIKNVIQVAIAQRMGRLFYFRDIPTWFVRFMAIPIKSINSITNRKNGSRQSSEILQLIINVAKEEWWMRKMKMIKQSSTFIA